MEAGFTEGRRGTPTATATATCTCTCTCTCAILERQSTVAAARQPNLDSIWPRRDYGRISLIACARNWRKRPGAHQPSIMSALHSSWSATDRSATSSSHLSICPTHTPPKHFARHFGPKCTSRNIHETRVCKWAQRCSADHHSWHYSSLWKNRNSCDARQSTYEEIWIRCMNPMHAIAANCRPPWTLQALPEHKPQNHLPLGLSPTDQRAGKCRPSIKN